MRVFLLQFEAEFDECDATVRYHRADRLKRQWWQLIFFKNGIQGSRKVRCGVQ